MKNLNFFISIYHSVIAMSSFQLFSYKFNNRKSIITILKLILLFKIHLIILFTFITKITLFIILYLKKVNLNLRLIKCSNKKNFFSF
jgi:hypothetical protein